MKNMNKNTCSNTELKMLGDFWTLAIVQTLNDGEKRFCQIQRELTQASPTTLTNRLRKLEEQKIIKRKEETLDKLSVVYFLTDKGQGILPILHEIRIFANKFLKRK